MKRDREGEAEVWIKGKRKIPCFLGEGIRTRRTVKITSPSWTQIIRASTRGEELQK